MKTTFDYREVIIANATNPACFVARKPAGAIAIPAVSATCAEAYDVFIRLNASKTIASALFTGSGCLISKAVLNIICTLIQGQLVARARAIITNYKAMMRGDPFASQTLGALVVFQKVRMYPARISCALLGAKAIEKLLRAQPNERTYS